MEPDLIDRIETFLAEGGEPKTSFTFAEMQEKYGDDWAADFKEQFKHFTGITLVGDEDDDDAT